MNILPNNNIMKFLGLTSFFMVLSLFVFSQQDKRLENADTYYSNYSFDKSIRAFESIENKDIEVKRKLATSYFNHGDYAKSEEYWQEVVKEEGRTADDIYNYASVLAINEKYESSEHWMREYFKLNKEDSRARDWVENTGFYNILKENKGIFTVVNLAINSEQQDFGTSYFANELTYASSRDTKQRFIKRVWNWNRLPFLDIYVGKVDTSLQIESAHRFRGNVNKRLHEGPATFNKSGNFMVYTRNNYDGQSEDNVVKLQLFESSYKDGEWQKPRPFPYNSNEYSVGHATLTASGDTMYFVSDMPGGIGGTDIYVSYKQKDGSWSKPENMGHAINTEGNEMFPFIHPDGTLYFASNGLLGLGGLDIFMSRNRNGKYEKPLNLGVPINGSHDDFAFILNEAQTSGYFSSNRPGGKGSDDIYGFRLLKPLDVQHYLEGKALDNDDAILAGTTVYLLSENGDTLASKVTEADGEYKFQVEGGKSYKLLGTKAKYIDGNSSCVIDDEVLVTKVDVVLNKKPKFKLNVIVTNSETGQPIDGVKVDIADQIASDNSELYTTSKGQVSQVLKNRKLQSDAKFIFSLNKTGYIPKKETWSKVLDHEGTYEVRISMLEISIAPIYFDYNKSFIRKDAKSPLDHVVELMNKYPNMVVELSSYTDCRGTKKYNQRLSNRRAKSSIRYIRKRLKVNPDRISGKGYGEAGLVNDCECEGSKRCNCSEAEHQLNRRTEFVIKKIE